MQGLCSCITRNVRRLGGRLASVLACGPTLCGIKAWSGAEVRKARRNYLTNAICLQPSTIGCRIWEQSKTSEQWGFMVAYEVLRNTPHVWPLFATRGNFVAVSEHRAARAILANQAKEVKRLNTWLLQGWLKKFLRHDDSQCRCVSMYVNVNNVNNWTMSTVNLMKGWVDVCMYVNVNNVNNCQLLLFTFGNGEPPKTPCLFFLE